MKTALALGLAVSLLASARAQVFRPEAVNGAVLGGIAGAVIGHNSGDLRHNGWKGAAIGAGAGLILGEALGSTRANRGRNGAVDYVSPNSSYVYRHSHAPSVHVAYQRQRGGYGYYGTSHHGAHLGYPYRGYRGRGHHWGYYGPSYRYVPSYSYYDGYSAGYPYSESQGGSAATRGLLLGALAGGIIGHNSGALHHEAWRGSAWGAGLGWLLGSVADARRRAADEAQPVFVPAAAPVVQVAPTQAIVSAPVATPASVSQHAASSSPMSAANRLFGRN